MSLDIKGTIHSIGQKQQVTDKFAKREFILAITEEINGNTYTNYAKFQCVQAKCDLLDRYQVGEDVTVSFNIKGNLWKDGCITNLDCWRIASASSNTPANHDMSGQQQAQGVATPEAPKDDLPF